MLVSRKQEWLEYEQPAEVKPQKPQVRKIAARPDAGLRRRCLQLIGLVVAVAMLIAVHSEAIIRSGYDLVEMKAQAAKLEKENEALRLDIAKLKSPQRIQQIATGELGMVLPQNAYYATATTKNAKQEVAEGKKAGAPVGMLKINKVEASSGR